MAISIIGQNTSATTSVTIPTHAAGDIIFITSSGGSAPTIPGAGGTVPTFNSIQSGAANTRGLTTAWARATAANHTSGTWTNATAMICIVIRGAQATGDPIGGSATANAANTQTVVYPALTVSITNGTSLGLRAGTRTTADTDLSTAPGSFTLQTSVPATPTLALHRLLSLTGDIAQESVSTPPTNSASRAHTIEVLAEPDAQNFNRSADDPLGLLDDQTAEQGIARSVDDVLGLVDDRTVDTGGGGDTIELTVKRVILVDLVD